MKIEQPWNDYRLKLNGRYIGCVTKENADFIMRLQENRIIDSGTIETLNKGRASIDELKTKAFALGLTILTQEKCEMAENAEVKVTVTVENIVINDLINIVQRAQDVHGVLVEQFSVDWLDIGTLGEPKKQVRQIRVQLCKDK